MGTQEKLEFPRMLRELRVANRLKQREVAEFLDMATSSYGNCEVNNHKTMSLSRVHRLARWYALDDSAASRLLSAWENLPASQYTERNRPAWERRNALRSQAKAAAPLRKALLEITTLLVTSVENPDELCACTDTNNECELCDALRLLGLKGWSSRDAVIAGLAEVQQEHRSDG
jgi:transcriptional regulator with XRE-family HTH domain